MRAPSCSPGSPTAPAPTPPSRTSTARSSWIPTSSSGALLRGPVGGLPRVICRSRRAPSTDRVASQSPQHPLAQSAQRLRDQIRTPEPERPWTLSLSAGGEYDSNPLLSGEIIPRDSDYRGVWRARGSYRVFERGGFTLSTGAEGYWSIHHDEDIVDLQTYLGFANATTAWGRCCSA
jgi:hypothetical protein